MNLLKSHVELNIFSFILFIWFISSLKPWFLWNYDYVVFILTFGFSFIILKSNIQLNNSKILSIILVILFHIYLSINGNLNNFILLIMKTALVINLILLSRFAQFKIMENIIRMFCVVLIVPFICWIINPIINLLPYNEISYDNNFYYFRNYFFYLEGIDQYITDEILFQRFRGFYLEPGHIAMIISFLLILRKCQFKDNIINQVLLVFLISTFSLVGYLILIIEYLLQNFFVTKNRVFILLVILLIGVVYTISLNYNQGDNLMNNLIFSRLEFDESKLIKGNNRNSIEIDIISDKLFENNDYLIGLPVSKLELINFTGSAGIKVFLIQYGLIGILLTFLMYYSFVRKNNDNTSTILFLLFILNFFQRSYPEWSSFLIIFIFANNYINFKSIKA